MFPLHRCPARLGLERGCRVVSRGSLRKLLLGEFLGSREMRDIRREGVAVSWCWSGVGGFVSAGKCGESMDAHPSQITIYMMYGIERLFW